MKKFVLMLVVLTLFAASPVLAGPDHPYRLAFITSTNGSVHFGQWDLSTSLADADAHVQSLADGAGIGIGGYITDPVTGGPIDVMWKVLGSASYVDARDHTNTNPLTDGAGVPIYLVGNMNDGITMVATGNADLWSGNPTGVINQDENGNTKNHWPLTGTYPDGTVVDGTKGDWGGSGGRGLDAIETEIQQGNGTLTTQMFYRQWTSRPADPSSDRYQELPIYAISEVIPEPATMALLGLGGLALLRRRRK